MTRTLRPVVLAGYLGAIATLLGAELGGTNWALAGVFATLAFAFVFKGAASASGVGVTLLGVGWIGLGLAYALLLRDIDEHGVLALYTVVLAVWAGDAAAYFIGLLFGRHKLAPTVSPGKTWEGLAAGTVATIAVAFIALYKQSFLSIPESLVLGLAIAIAAPLGDLFESALKRDADVKDSGRLLGGHGGVLDRIDALLFAWVSGVLRGRAPSASCSTAAYNFGREANCGPGRHGVDRAPGARDHRHERRARGVRARVGLERARRAGV